MPITELLVLAQKLSGISFATLLVLIIFGNYKGWWKWGWACAADVANLEARLAKAETTSDKWQAMALRATGLAEDSVGLAKKGTS